MRIHLTKKAVENLQPDLYRPSGFYWDSELIGFGVRVLPSGHKSYVVRKSHRDSDGRVVSRFITLGSTSELDFYSARSFAKAKILQYRKNMLFSSPEALKQRNPFEEDLTQPILPFKIRFQDFCKKFVHLKEREWSQNTFNSYTSRIDGTLIPYFRGRYLDEIKKKDILEFKHHLANTPALFQVCLSLLKTIFNMAIDMEYMDSNPATGVTLYAPRKKTKTLTKEEIQRIFHYLSTKNDQEARVLQVLILTGFRVSEVLKSKWENITDYEWIFPYINSKTGRHTILPLTDPLRNILQKQREAYEEFMIYSGGKLDIPLIFFNPTLQPHTALSRYKILGSGVRHYLSSVQILHYFKKVTRELQIHPIFTPHDLRHAFASILVNSGFPIGYVKEAMGHSSIKMTERYAHFDNQNIMKTLQQFQKTIFS